MKEAFAYLQRPADVCPEERSFSGKILTRKTIIQILSLHWRVAMLCGGLKTIASSPEVASHSRFPPLLSRRHLGEEEGHVTADDGGRVRFRPVGLRG